MAETPNIGLTYLEQAQSDKESTINANSDLLDALIVAIQEGAIIDACMYGARRTWTVTAALLEFAASASALSRTQLDLSAKSQARIVAAVDAAADPGEFRGQYSTDGGSNWDYLDGVTGPTCGIAVGVNAGAWVDLAIAAKADVLLRVVTINGDNDTAGVGPIRLQFR